MMFQTEDIERIPAFSPSVSAGFDLLYLEGGCLPRSTCAFFSFNNYMKK